MKLIRKLLSSGEGSSFFIQNGRKLLEELVTQREDGQSKISLRNFSSKELAQATNNFSSHDLVTDDNDHKIYRGSFDNSQILVKEYKFFDNSSWRIEHIVRDIAISSHMSFHKNVLKLIGYCLDYQYPTLVYQSPKICINLADHLLNTKLTWESKLSLALDIANVLVYLHTGFQTPIIHRHIKLGDVVIDKYVTAKLMDFSLCISIPRGECQVEDAVMGTYGYADPEYVATGFLTVKSDVYNFGVVLIELLTGKKRSDFLRTENPDSWLDYLRSYSGTEQAEVIVNGDMMTKGETKHIRAFAMLALKCIGKERNSRPEMIDIAKELMRIQRSVFSS